MNLSNNKSAFLIILVGGAILGFNSFLTTNEVDNWCKENNVLEGYYLGVNVMTEGAMDDSTESTILSETNTTLGEYPAQVDDRYFAVKSEDKIWEFRAALNRKDISYQKAELVRMSPNFEQIIDERKNKFNSKGIDESDILVDDLKSNFYVKLNEDSNVTKKKEQVKNVLSDRKRWPLSVDVYCKK